MSVGRITSVTEMNIAVTFDSQAALLQFSLPILQELLEKPQPHFALILSPTRELAIQIAEQVEALGSGIGVKAAVLVGGIDMMAQAIALGKRPHIIVGTPGRVVDPLSNTKVRRSHWPTQTCIPDQDPGMESPLRD